MAGGAVSVPGTSGSTITYNFSNAQNTALAQQIANVLVTASVAGSLNVQAYSGSTPSPVPGDTNELAVSAAGGVVSVPAGYTYTVDSTGGGNFSVLGAQNFIGGDGNIAVTSAAGTSTDNIVLGNGSDTTWLVAGSTYNVAAGNGADTFTAAGTGTVTGGTGANTFFVGGASTTSGSSSNVVVSNGTDTVIAGYGTASIIANNSALIFNGLGNDTDFVNGSATIVSSANTASTIAGGPTGAETVFGNTGASQTIFDGGSKLEFVAGANDSATILGGSTQATLFGGSGSNINYANQGTGSITGALFVAGSGNETLNAAGSNSANTFWGGTGADSMVGGSGNDLMIAGTGSGTMAGGAGNNIFEFLNGHAGGNYTISDFSSNDLLALFGYGSAAGANAIANATVSGGSTHIMLGDNTQITFTNIATPNSIKSFSG